MAPPCGHAFGFPPGVFLQDTQGGWVGTVGTGFSHPALSRFSDQDKPVCARGQKPGAVCQGESPVGPRVQLGRQEPV